MVAALPKGSALWKVGNRSFQVEHVLSAWERGITFTDERMVVGRLADHRLPGADGVNATDNISALDTVPVACCPVA